MAVNQSYKSWLDTQMLMLCWSGELRQEPTFYQMILCDVYPELLAKGYEIPLSIVLDISCLAYFGPYTKLEIVNEATSKDKTINRLRRSYLIAINRAIQEGIFGKILEEVFLFIRDLYEKEKDNVEKQIAKILLAFWEVLLFCWWKNPDLAIGLNKSTLEKKIGNEYLLRRELEMDDELASNPSAVTHLKSFLQALFSGKKEEQEQIFNDVFQDEMYAMLATAGPDIHRIDTLLVQICASLQGLELSEDQAGKYRLRIESLVSRKIARWVVGGNNGLTNRGPLTAVLRSELAKPMKLFQIRYALKQLQYYDRYKPEKIPDGVVIVCYVNVGQDMKERTNGEIPFHSLSKGVAAALLEDMVRFYFPLEAINLRMAIVLHNGESGRKLRTRMFIPNLADLQRAPTFGEGKSSESGKWFTRIRASRPAYFFYHQEWDIPAYYDEPYWKAGKPEKYQVPELADSIHHQLALTFMRDCPIFVPGIGLPNIKLLHSIVIDHAANIEPNKSDLALQIPASGLDVAADASVNTISVDSKQFIWECWPGSHAGILNEKREIPLEEPPQQALKKLIPQQLRMYVWNDVLDRLSQL